MVSIERLFLISSAMSRIIGGCEWKPFAVSCKIYHTRVLLFSISEQLALYVSFGEAHFENFNQSDS
jgi:hypothetical protein